MTIEQNKIGRAFIAVNNPGIYPENESNSSSTPSACDNTCNTPELTIAGLEFGPDELSSTDTKTDPSITDPSIDTKNVINFSDLIPDDIMGCMSWLDLNGLTDGVRKAIHRENESTRRINNLLRAMEVQRNLYKESEAELRQTIQDLFETNASLRKNLAQQQIEFQEQLNGARRLLTDSIDAKDNAYWERNQLLLLLFKMAIFVGWEASLTKHPESDPHWEDDWRNIVYIITPQGQATWHIHDNEAKEFMRVLNLVGKDEYNPDFKWDGHTTETKYNRLKWIEVFQDDPSFSFSAGYGRKMKLE